jgi:hypothetical protein
VVESPKEVESTNFSNSVKTERNRLVSWESQVHELTSPAVVIPSFRTAIKLGALDFVNKATKLIFATLIKLAYTVFKLGYEIAKLITMGLSSIRRLLFPAK